MNRTNATVSNAGSVFGRAALAAFLALGMTTVSSARAQASAARIDQRAPRTETLATYLDDFEEALQLSSPASAQRARDVDDARIRLALDRRGTSASGTLQPGAEFERDQALGSGAWEFDVDFELTAAYAYDHARILRSEVALERAEARLRAQQRADLERALLAMSASRLSAIAVEDARADLAEAEAELAAATASGQPPLALETLAVEVELAGVALEQELLAHRERSEALAELGLSEVFASGAANQVAAAANVSRAWLALPPAPELAFPAGTAPRTAPLLRLLSMRLALAEQALALAPFEAIRELEFYGGYEVNGVTAGGRFALEVGVPTAVASLGWQTDSDDHALTVGVGATFRLSDSSSAGTKVAQRDVTDARLALAEHIAAWPQAERRAAANTDLAYREFALELRLWDISNAALEQVEAGDEREMRSRRNTVRRARVAGERAWQRYVRALTDYLDVIDVVLRFD